MQLRSLSPELARCLVRLGWRASTHLLQEVISRVCTMQARFALYTELLLRVGQIHAGLNPGVQADLRSFGRPALARAVAVLCYCALQLDVHNLSRT